MEQKISFQQLAKVKLQRNIAILWLLLMIISNLIFGIVILNNDDKTIIIPANLKQVAWISRTQVSAEYLEEIADYYANLLLNVTSRNYGKKLEIVLRHVHPDHFKEILNQQSARANKYEELDASTSFQTMSLQTDAEQLKVIVTGRLIQYVSGHQTGSDIKKYQLRFNNDQKILTLTHFQEIKNDK